MAAIVKIQCFLIRTYNTLVFKDRSFNSTTYARMSFGQSTKYTGLHKLFFAIQLSNASKGFFWGLNLMLCPNALTIPKTWNVLCVLRISLKSLLNSGQIGTSPKYKRVSFSEEFCKRASISTTASWECKLFPLSFRNSKLL